MKTKSINHWLDPNFPKLNWTCTGTTDLLQATGDFGICEMCGYKEIRYGHHMAHATAPNIMAGALCAEIMMHGFNPLAARHRVNRRNKWLKRRWRQENGVEIVCSKGYEFRVYPSNGGMKWEVLQQQPKPVKPPGVKRMKRPLPVLIHSGHAPGTADAKLASFDAVWP